MQRKIKILHVSESSETGGAETVLLNIVNNLDERRYHSIVVLLKTGWLYERLEKSGISPILLKSDRAYDVNFLLRLWSTVKKQDVEIIHSHLPGANAYSCLAGRAAGVPVVATYHGMLSACGKLRASEKLQLFLVRNFSKKIVSVSDSLRQELIQLAKFPSSKLKTIYNGVDWDKFDRPFEKVTKMKELGVDSNDKVIGMVANLKATKGYQYFIRAAAIVANSISQVKFLVIGEGEEGIKLAITEEVRLLGLGDKVRFLGFREDVPELLRMLDVFVLSSVSEGMSLSTVEAMGSGVPVVVTKSGGPQELVEDGRTGFLVPPRDENSLAEKVLFLLKNQGASNEMAREARSYVRKEFSTDNMIENYETVYQECLKEGGT